MRVATCTNFMSSAVRYTPAHVHHAFGDKVPVFAPDAFVHPDATVIGDVVLEDGANVWPGAVLRGDVERIVLGAADELPGQLGGAHRPRLPGRRRPAAASSATA